MRHAAPGGRRLGTVGRPGRAGAALNLYLDLSRLASVYLAHQLVEETEVMPALRAAVPADELVAVDMAIRGSLPPEEMAEVMTHMLPAMDIEERAEMLGGMAMAPPEIFSILRATARAVLFRRGLGAGGPAHRHLLIARPAFSAHNTQANRKQTTT